MKIIKSIFIILFNAIAFLSLSTILIYIWWITAGKAYVFSSQPLGGDYFNALTYVDFFYHYFPFPPIGWVPFWNEGSPVIGGYPWLAFYLMKPLMSFFDPVNTMEIFSNISLALFFIASLLLFRQVSKNWLIAFALSLLLVVTRATYFPLMAGGFVVSSTVQWYLPTVLLFISIFSEKNKRWFLVIAAIFAGLSLLQHAPTTIITILLPSILVITLYKTNKPWIIRLLDVAIFLAIACAIGAMGLYTQILQTVSGSGTTLCTSPECWGVYPRHLISWMHPVPPLLLLFLIVLALMLKIFRKKISIFIALPAYGGFFVLLIYALAAYLHLIDGPANVFFPTRLFWAANLFLLLMSAFIFQSIQGAFKKISYILSLCITLAIATAVYVYPSKTYIGSINTVPVDAAIYTIPKYKIESLDKLVPSWISFDEKNWRLDTFNPGLTQWWTYTTGIPDTRGYSIGINQDWQYFLQYATRDPKLNNQELMKNRALFLIDAFGVGLRENSVASYPESILTDPNLITNNERKRDFFWYKLSPNYFSPIVFPTSSSPVLFIGDENGYVNFIRSITMTNLNSSYIIPVKGPKNIGDISSDALSHYKAVIDYQFEGNDWSKLTTFVKNGGLVFIETTSLKNPPKNNLAEIFPVNSVKEQPVQDTLKNATVNKSDVTDDINITKFAPLSYENGPWKLSVANVSDVREWAQSLIQKENNVLLAKGGLGKGTVVWSGMNLLYHIVKYDNYEEAKMFANIVKPITSKNLSKPNATIERDDPRIIHVTGDNLTGIYFKENYDPGWTAVTNGKRLPVYEAGLDFMYVPIPQTDQNKEVTLTYNGNIINWLLFIVSTSSLIFAILYIMNPHPFRLLKQHTHHHLKHKVGKRITTWWQKEKE